MLKKIIKNLILILFIIIVVITLTGCSKQKTDEEQLRDKNISEIQYIDNYILLMLNNINNIDLKQYNTKIENTENLNEVLKEEENSKSNDVQYSMIQTTILNSDKSTNWQNLKIQIENLNKIWPSIIVDLYKANVENNKLTDFSDLLNVCIGNIKKEDKVETLKNLSRLYEYIPIYLEKIVDDNQQLAISRTKIDVIKAYVNINLENWEELKSNLENAISNFEIVVNNVNETEKEYNVKKAYVLLQEFKNSVNTHDMEILFSKYKNLMEELIIL